jgi:hypothetical protein
MRVVITEQNQERIGAGGRSSPIPAVQKGDTCRIFVLLNLPFPFHDNAYDSHVGS